MIEDMPGGAFESDFKPGVTPVEVEHAPEPGCVKSKFEPGITVEPKVDVIPGAAAQGNSLPADRPGDTAKRKIAFEPGTTAERTIAKVDLGDTIGCLRKFEPGAPGELTPGGPARRH